jgi:predicted nucleic acid-binding protein
LDNAVLLDTNIVSLLLKEASVHEGRRDSLNVMLRGKVAFISFVTVAELLLWAERRSWGQKKRDDLDVRLRIFGILDPTRDTAELWARTKSIAMDSGNTLAHHDLWIAAASLEHDLPLVSDDGDFDRVAGLKRITL